MSVIVFPDFAVASFRWHKANQAISFRSQFGSQAIEVATPLWEVEMMGVAEYRADATVIQTFIESLEGYLHQVGLWNLHQPVPAGTMRGSMVLEADAAQGATTLSISATGQGGKTLLKGDLIGLGSGLTQQVVRVTADAVANGSGVNEVTIGTALRNAFAAGAAVTWDKPQALFRAKAPVNGLSYSPDFAQPWSMTLIEDWRP